MPAAGMRVSQPQEDVRPVSLDDGEHLSCHQTIRLKQKEDVQLQREGKTKNGMLFYLGKEHEKLTNKSIQLLVQAMTLEHNSGTFLRLPTLGTHA
jgi:hypothetical protein